MVQEHRDDQFNEHGFKKLCDYRRVSMIGKLSHLRCIRNPGKNCETQLRSVPASIFTVRDGGSHNPISECCRCNLCCNAKSGHLEYICKNIST